MRKFWILLSIAFLAGILLACQSATPSAAPIESAIPQMNNPEILPESSETQELASTSTSEDTEMSAPTTPDASSEQLINLVKQHLAKQLGISMDQIAISNIKPVVWRDAGLGCPKPGVDYIQVETPGYQIVLEAQGQSYNYHTDETQRFVPCRS
jgi:hypothetical protein